MYDINLDNLYFNWICQVIGNRKSSNYMGLLAYLNTIKFTYVMDIDDNRMLDGIDLRYRFGYEKIRGEEYRKTIDRCFDMSYCSVLEMMVALSIRSSDIEGSPDVLFWEMIENLNIIDMDNEHLDLEYVDRAISDFLKRRYSYYGEGGLFVIKNPKRDMRNVDIWTQMCWYIYEKNYI